MKNLNINLLFLIFSLATTSLYSMKSTLPTQDPYFKNVPKEYHKIIQQSIDSYKKDPKKETYRRAYHYFAITDQDKHIINNTRLSNCFQSTNGYWLLTSDNPLCTGKSSHTHGYDSLSLKRDWETTENNSALLKQLTNDYTIHLMPIGSAIEDLDQLIELIKNDEELGKAIVAFKILFNFKDDNDFKENKTIFPKIVIYAASGKENAQFVLNKIYAAFKDKKGLGITPRHNQKVTDYIYYAQGNGGDKDIEEYKFFFEPDMIHYKSTITGTAKDYHLNILPDETGQLTKKLIIAPTQIITPADKRAESTKRKKETQKTPSQKCYDFISSYWKQCMLLVGSLPIASFVIYQYWMQK